MVNFKLLIIVIRECELSGIYALYSFLMNNLYYFTAKKVLDLISLNLSKLKTLSYN